MTKTLSRLLVAVLCTRLTVSAWGAEPATAAPPAPAATPPAAKPKVVKPGELPAAGIDRILLTWAGDPATSQSITWRTGEPSTNPLVEVAVSSANPKFGTNAVTVAAVTRPLTRSDDVTVYYHRVTLNDLTPATVYAYRVGHGKDWSEWNQFRTAAREAQPFSFIYLGDVQTHLKPLCSRIFRAAVLKAADPRFILHLGDLVEAPEKDKLWAEWFEAAGWIFRTLPSLPVPGNHDQYGAITKTNEAVLSQYWPAQFALPTNGPAGLEGMTCFITYQGVLFVSLNSERDLEVQAQWLDKVLTENPGRSWTVVSIHATLFSSGGKGTPDAQVALQKVFLPVIDKHKVDLVLQGHYHIYSRSHKLQGGKGVDPKAAGTVYCTSVAGSKMYPLNPAYDELMRRKGDYLQLFQIISVDGKTLRYESWTVTGDLFDSFSLVKDDAGASELVEKPGP